MNAFGRDTFHHLWEIFLLFAVPIGGGIPAGVVLARKYGIGWLPMTTVYFLSDVILAFLFEPLMLGIAFLGRFLPVLARIIELMKIATQKTIARYGEKPSVALLIGISFGIDPMTGRAAALASGHNFISGWAVAIAGDMIFFGMIAVSTLFLSNILGDGTVAALLVMGVMFLIPMLVDRYRGNH